MNEEEIDKILAQSKKNLQETLNKEDPSLKELEELLGAEKELENRKSVKSLFETLIFSRKLLKNLERDEGSFENIKSIQSSLDEIEDVRKLNDLDSKYEKVEILDKLFGTVKEFKSYSEDLDLDSEQAELILKVEISGKNRKGVKNFLKDRIKYFQDDETKFERKIELKKELDLDVSDEWLEDIDLKKLENIKKEKSHRESLIAEINEEVDEEPGKLKKASTSDLEKIASEVVN